MESLPPLDALRCFVQAARLLSFRKAARAVALTPSAFSARIQQLEDVVGTPLFTRTTRSVRLTLDGLALLPRAQQALAAVEEAVRSVGRGLPPMTLVIGTRHELGLSWLLPALDDITAKLGSVQCDLYFGSGADLLSRVRTAEIDCAIASVRMADPKLEFRKLHREEYAFVAARALIEKTPLRRASDAARHTLVDSTRELPLFRYFRDAHGTGDRLQFGAVECLGTIAAIRERVLQKRGVAVLPEYFVRDDLGKKRLVRLFPSVEPLHDYFRLIFRGDDPRRALYERLAEVLVATPLR